MDIYIDVLRKIAVTSSTDSTPAVRPDIRTPTTYPVNLYFLRSDGFGSYTYTRFPSAAIALNVRCKAPVEAARFSLAFRGAETPEIDTRFSAGQIQDFLTLLPSIGAGNVTVRKDNDKLTIEFVNMLAGQVMPPIIARVVSSTPTGARPTWVVAPMTGDNKNSIQTLSLDRPPLATVTTWTEIGVGSTPGWTGTLNMTAVPLSAWDSPVGDMVIEVKIAAQFARNGTDGVTLTDAIGRSGTDGQIVASPGTVGVAHLSDNGSDSFLIATDSNGVYGRKFVPGDVGRTVTDGEGYLFPGTVIVEVTDDGIMNTARLSQRFTQFGMGLAASISYTIAGLPSDVMYSATANWKQADIGHAVTGTNVPAGTRIANIIDAGYVRLSQKATGFGSGLTWTVASDTQTVFQSATALFGSSDVGAKIRAPALFDGDVTITKWISTTQVEVSVRPKVVATAVTWRLLPARAYPPPVVARTSPGNTAAPEKQKITLAQVATGGQLVFQDGYGTSLMPQITLDNPIGADTLQNALNQAYPNYGYCKVKEVIPGAEWDVTFGKNGGQRLLTVSEVQAIYEGAVLDWVIADGAAAPLMLVNLARPEWTGGSPATLTRNGITYINVARETDQWTVGTPRYSRMSDGTRAQLVKFKRMGFSDKHVPYSIGASLGNDFYVVSEEPGEEKHGMYISEVVGATIPRPRNESHQQMRAVISVLKSTVGGRLVDVQLVAVSISTSMRVEFLYWNQGTNEPPLPPDSKTATIVHYVDGSYELKPYNNFNVDVGNFGIPDWISWSRRRWMGNIWEQRKNWG